MHRVLLAFLTSLLTVSCTSSVVHVYTAGMEAGETREIIRIVESLGFRTRTNNLAIPPEITEPTLIYSYFRQDLTDIDRLEAAMADAGYAVALERESSGNHIYTRNNIGLFPRQAQKSGTGVVETAEDLESPSALAGREFTATCLDENQDGYLLLDERRRFILDFFAWDESGNEHPDGSVRGSWELNGQVLQLDGNVDAAPFVLETSLEEFIPESGGPSNSYAVINLNNVLKNSGVFRGCDFSHVGSLDRNRQ